MSKSSSPKTWSFCPLFKSKGEEGDEGEGDSGEAGGGGGKGEGGESMTPFIAMFTKKVDKKIDGEFRILERLRDMLQTKKSM